MLFNRNFPMVVPLHKTGSIAYRLSGAVANRVPRRMRRMAAAVKILQKVNGYSMKPLLDIIPENARAEDSAAILDVLQAHAAGLIGAVEEQSDFAVLLRDPESGQVVGGLYGVDGYGWAFIKYLAVPEACRGLGLGSRLMQEAETIARARGYMGVWLDTFAFQAKPFYEKLGYTVFGALPGGPNAIQRYFLRKQF